MSCLLNLLPQEYCLTYSRLNRLIGPQTSRQASSKRPAAPVCVTARRFQSSFAVSIEQQGVDRSEFSIEPVEQFSQQAVLVSKCIDSLNGPVLLRQTQERLGWSKSKRNQA